MTTSDFTDTRERIIDAAGSLFHRQGYSAVGVAEICARAGVVKGSFYHFFPGKQDLLLAVIDRNWGRLGRQLTRLRAAPGTARERLLAYFRGVVDSARRTRKAEGQVLGCDIGSMACEIAPLPGELQPRLRSVMRTWCDALQVLIEDGQADGSLSRSLDARAAAESLLALTQGMSVLGRTFDQPAVLARVAEQAGWLLPAPSSAPGSRGGSA